MPKPCELAQPVRALGLAMVAVYFCFGYCRAEAQVFEINGGSSSLYQANGGSVSMHAPGYNASIGAGMVGGHFSYGAKVEKMMGKTLVTLGDDQIDILLPTDVFNASHYVYGRGVGVGTKIAGTDVFAFGGTSSTMYQTPIFEGAGSGDGMGALSLHRTMSPKWQLWSDTIFSSKMTQIVAAQWTPRKKFYLAASAGVGANQPYFAGSMNFSRKYVDVLGSYVLAGSSFRRVIVSSPIQAEPDKGNLLVTVKPTRFLTLTGGTQNFQVPELTTNTTVTSGVEEASAALQVARAVLSGSVYQSTALGESSHAAAFTASREVTSRLKLMSNYMVSKPQGAQGTSSFFTTITEVLNQHVSVNENISTSNGQTSLFYGGSLLTNLVSISANYETFYVPVHAANPFQQSLMLDVSLRLFGRASLHGSSFVGPDGKTLYTATGSALAVHGQTDPITRQPMSLGQSEIHVLVIDPENRPVEGAALMIDEKPVFTGADGVFSMRERKPHAHSIKVLTDEFLDGGSWEVKSIPRELWSSPREDEAGVVIIVRRLPLTRATTDIGPSDSGPSNQK